MKKPSLKKSAGLIASAGAGAVLALSPQLAAAGNPFALEQGSGATIVVADSGKKGISVLEGKCGAGKCGTQRIRQMMDRNADGRINREEYVSWAAAQASSEFDDIADGSGSVGADKVFEHFRSLEFHSQG